MKQLNLTLSKSIDGFLNYKLAEGLTQRSVNSYEWVLFKWVEHRGDRLLTDVTVDNIRDYPAWLHELAPKLSLAKLSEGLGGLGRPARMIPNAPAIVNNVYRPTIGISRRLWQEAFRKS
jgi:hypothetical protein